MSKQYPLTVLLEPPTVYASFAQAAAGAKREALAEAHRQEAPCCVLALARAACCTPDVCIKGNRLSNTTCLTQVFLRSGE